MLSSPELTVRLEAIHATLGGALQHVDAEGDLARFAHEHGTAMPFLLPVSRPSMGVLSHLEARHSVSHAQTDMGDFHEVVNPVGGRAPGVTHTATPTTGGAGGPLTAGMRLRALFDYAALKTDELAFSFKDVLVVLPTAGNVSCVCGEENIYPYVYCDRYIDIIYIDIEIY